MSIVRSLLSALPPDVQEKRFRWDNDIMAEEKQHDMNVKLLETYTSEYTKRIEDLVDLMKKYVLETNTEADQPDMVDMSEMKKHLCTIQIKIDDSAMKISELRLEHAEIVGPYLTQIRTDALTGIQNSAQMSELICPQCDFIGPPVSPLFCCYENIDHRTGRPACSQMICFRCFYSNMHRTHNDPFDYDPCEYDPPQCHECLDVYSRASSNCLPNMLAMRMADSYLSSENSEFMKFFNVPLNPIKCTHCDRDFSGLSDLYNHIYSHKDHPFCRVTRETN